MKNPVKKISLEKEGRWYTLYIDGYHCGSGDLEDLLEVLTEEQDRLDEYVKEAQEFR